MPPFVAGFLVFTTSAAILILEILAGRLLAPYVGDTLETYSGVIGTVLAGIALGTWAGGRLADRIDPRRLIGPLLVAGGVLAIVAVPVVRTVGQVGGGQVEMVLLLSGLGFFPTAAVLSAVSPVVVKLELHDLAVTGQIVGRISALGTAGAIIGTFLAGFVLIGAAPTSVTIVVIGSLLIVGGLVAWVLLDRLRWGSAGAVAVAVLAGFGLGAVVDDPCEVETTYHCARVAPDPDRPTGQVLWLDTLRHSYVDEADPAHLEFAYTQLFAAATDAFFPTDSALDALHVGGGAFTMPRWLQATRPDTSSVVLEIDDGLVDLVDEQLPPPTDVDLEVRLGDGRRLVLEVPDASQDIVYGDAFGGLAAPWHLTTEEFVTEVHRVLRPGGIYVANLIDRPPLRFTRSEAATFAEVFAHVAVIAPAATIEGRSGSNVVVLASDDEIPVAALEAAVAARGLDDVVLTGADLEAFVDDAPVLTDDYAPIDQWLASSATGTAG
ncbi:fused MFS/spermidine synthase [Rhabdothermincola salaria]|uniref:fused MFS/spermidine synthase n=1 Tax=Rhabdothermincola salaria TaxID=2903142 RepID=UPI001E55BDC1|nr:fused MFS/spermidine synthase [Rhabdothermincola salaria]MCD9625147.1 fused MFS/spermidine synthase [Rhabdothermincola salaria]